MKQTVLFIITFLLATRVIAQDDLFGTASKTKSRAGFILCANGSLELPGADMAHRFGFNGRIGPGILYKTHSNWYYGVKADFIFGGKVKEDSLMANIKDKDGELITSDGQREIVPTYERGYLIGLQAGKLINLSKTNGDNGILFLTSVGFMQHKINIYDKDKVAQQLLNGYIKGYDRLTNGMYVEESVTYNYFAFNHLVNFYIGLDITAGFTEGRRDYLYDVMQSGHDKRLDILFGIRGGWYLPLFKHKSEDLLFQ